MASSGLGSGAPEVRSPGGLLAMCCLAMLSIGFAANTPALCLTAVASDLGLDSARSGLFLSCSFWGLVMSIPIAGPLADRCGFRYLIVASAVLQSLGLATVSCAHGLWQACLGAGITGLGTGIVDALLTPLACAAYPKARAWTANLLHAFYPIGIFLVVLIVLALTHMGWAWRGIYRFIAATNAPYAVIFLLIPLPLHSHEGAERMPGRRLVRLGSFLLLLGAIFLAGVTELGPSQWLPAYVEQAAGGTRTASALGLLLLGGMMAIGRLGNSFLARRVSPRRLVVAGAAVCVVSLLLSSLPAGPLFTMACLGVLGLGVAGLWPTVLSIAGNRFPQAGASMYSLLHVSGNMGGLVGPLAIGLVAQNHGLRMGMAALALAPAAILLLRVLDRGDSEARDV